MILPKGGAPHQHSMHLPLKQFVPLDIWIFPELTAVIVGYGLARPFSNVNVSGDMNPGSGTHWVPFWNILGRQVQADALPADTGVGRGQSNVLFSLQDLLAGHPWHVDRVDGSKARICRSRKPQMPLASPLMDMLMYLAVMLLQEVMGIMVLTKVVVKLASVPEL